MIDITGVNLVKFAQDVYDLSSPQGMGFMHFEEGPLSEEDAKKSVNGPEDRIALSMDYVHGRACKMTVFRNGDRLEIRDDWYDHSERALDVLLKRIKEY